MSGGLRRALTGSRRELLVGLGVAVLSMLVIGRLGRDFWFRYDQFYLLTRDPGSLNDWLRPHAGHWVGWTVLQYRVLGALVHADYWPWYYLSRLVGHAALAFLLWRVLLHRGADRLLAGGAYVAMLFMATSYFHDALTVGNYFVFGGLAIAALLLLEVDQPRARHLLLMGGCLLAGLVGNGYGVSVYGAVVLVALATRRFPRWAAALVPPGVIYAVWYLHYRSTFPDDPAPVGVRTAIDSVEPSFVVLRTAVENSLGLPGALAAVAVVGLIGLVLWWVVRGRLDRFDAVMVVTLALALASLAITRTVPRPGTATEDRYGYAIVLLVVLLVVPHLRVPDRTAVQVAVAVVLAAIVVVNVVDLRTKLDEREEVSQEIRAEAETTAALIRAGEPYVSYARYPSRVVPFLIQEMVDDGWDPPISPDQAVVDEVRTGMRITTPDDNRIENLEVGSGTPPTADGVDAEGCLVVEPGEEVPITVTGEAAIRPDGLVRITWVDRFGTAGRVVGDQLVGLADPVDEPEVTLATVRGNPVEVCGLAPSA